MSVIDAVSVLVGVVVGIGIFGFPPLVAQNASSPGVYLMFWVAGGLVMLVGALCYAELGSAHPDAGGEYLYLRLAWGRPVSLLFAWARGSVIQTGAIAAVAFIYGEYAQVLLPLGDNGPAWHAGIVVVLLTGINFLGNMLSQRAQRVLTGLTLLALVIVSVAGLLASGPATGQAAPELPSLSFGAMGMGMVFVLLTYGGWNEAAYLSGELRNPSRNVPRVLIIGSVLVMALYLLINLAYLNAFGLEGLAQSGAVGAQLMGLVAGDKAAIFLSLLICCAALGTINGSIYTGARMYTAIGRDVQMLSFFRTDVERGMAPRRALLLQGVITLVLVVFGGLSGNGVELMVAYTAPVFWFFMALVALAVIRLRRREAPAHEGAFRLPFYPLPPLLLAASCFGLFWSSAQYAGVGAWFGLLVLVAGIPLLWADHAWQRRRAAQATT